MTHPSEILIERLEELGLTIEEFAVISDISILELNNFIDSKSPVDEVIANKFENALKIPATFWLNLQNKYNEIMVERKSINEVLSKIKPKFKTNTNIN